MLLILVPKAVTIHHQIGIYDMTTPANHPRDPLHGITLESIINQLVQRHGWSEMGRRIPVRCFRLRNPASRSCAKLHGRGSALKTGSSPNHEADVSLKLVSMFCSDRISAYKSLSNPIWWGKHPISPARNPAHHP